MLLKSRDKNLYWPTKISNILELLRKLKEKIQNAQETIRNFFHYVVKSERKSKILDPFLSIHLAWSFNESFKLLPGSQVFVVD